jgi:hypothetical protein
MKAMVVFLGLFLLPAAIAQEKNEDQPNGQIYGIVVDPNGNPAKGITVEACPQGVPLSTVLPRTRSNDTGEYRFEKLPWWGTYRVYAEDDDAGYSTYSTGPGRNEPREVKLTPHDRKAYLKVYLPLKAGFLHIRLTNRRTGNAISGMAISVMSMEQPNSLLYSMSCYSSHVVLLPPDRDVLLHVTSEGFKEWKDSVGKGKPLRLSSGAQSTLDIQLEPTD